MSRILLSIFQDNELSPVLAFKGGTSLMFFHNLPRFSTDLDFNLLDETQGETVYRKIKSILLQYGSITDEAQKFYGPILVLDYGKGERKLKVEISTRFYDNHYEICSFAGTDIRLMTMPDMFAHKLCALGERATPRDVFDVWFFMKHNTEVNENIIRLRTNMSVQEYALLCARKVESITEKELMQGLGEVLDNKQKSFVRSKLIEETASLLSVFASFPMIAQQSETTRWQLIRSNMDKLQQIEKADIDLSTLSEIVLRRLFGGETLTLRTRHNQSIPFHLY